MPRYNRRTRWSAAAEPAKKAPVTKEFLAPAVGLEDKVFTVGSTMDAARFEVVKKELDKHFATQPWSDGANVTMALYTLTEPLYNEPEELDIPERFITTTVGGESTEDPAYEVTLMRHKMQISKYACSHNEWSKNKKNWKNNHSCMFAIVLQYSPNNLVQWLKSKVQ